MTVVRVKGFKIFRDRHRKWRCYHRKTRTPVDLAKAPLGSAEFFAECLRIADKAKDLNPKPGTLGMLIEEYRASVKFRDLAPQTRADYQKVFDYLKPIADTPLTRFNTPLVVRIHDKALARGRRFANYVKAVLSILFNWGRPRGYVTANFAQGIDSHRRPRGMPEANRPWSDEEREAVLEAAPAHIKPSIALMMFTGLGPKDALTLPRNFYRDGEIATRRSKTGEPVFWPAPALLAQLLEQAPAHNATTLCAIQRPAVDTERLPGLVAHSEGRLADARKCGLGADLVRAPAHSCSHSSRDGL
jgi:hypothetical protein